jgi:hypothetical protein
LLLRLVVPMISSALRSGGHVVFRPPSHFSSREIGKALGNVHGLPKVGDSLRVLSWDGSSALSGIPEGFPLAVASQGILESRRIIDVMDSSLDSTGAIGDVESFLSLAGFARRSGNPLGIVLVARNGENFFESIRSRSLPHLLIHARRGQFFMTGTRPWTPNLVFTKPQTGGDIHSS